MTIHLSTSMSQKNRKSDIIAATDAARRWWYTGRGPHGPVCPPLVRRPANVDLAGPADRGGGARWSV